VVAAAVLVVALAAGCGGGSSAVSAGASKELLAKVAAVREASVRHDADGARRALDDLRASVKRRQDAGEISDERAAELLAAASTVEANLVSITTTTTTTTTLPPTTKPGKGNQEKDGHGNGHGGND
jgi:hypothetical protein